MYEYEYSGPLSQDDTASSLRGQPFTCSGTALPWLSDSFFVSISKRVFSDSPYLSTILAPTPTRSSVNLIWRVLAQRLMHSFRIVKHKVFRQSQQQVGQSGIAFQIHIFMFDATPEPLHKNIIQSPATPIHADDNTVYLEYTRKSFTGELPALVGVKCLRHSVLLQSLFQTIHTEPAIQRVRQTP